MVLFSIFIILRDFLSRYRSQILIYILTQTNLPSALLCKKYTTFKILY